LRVRINGETREYRTVWMEGQGIHMIDQRLLPHRFEVHQARDCRETAEAIKNMTVRGAGAIGVTAAYGVAQAALQAPEEDLGGFRAYVEEAARSLKVTRPTAVNLFHAVDRCINVLEGCRSVVEGRKRVAEEAERIAEEDLEASRRIGEYGNELIRDGDSVLTHCNAGALAFIDYGTALSPIRFAHRAGKRIRVLVDETRPRCQGARLTAWELLQEGIDHAVIVDNAAGYYMRHGDIQLVIVGADRIASNGDTANKIGTYEKAVLAKENGIPFYVAAPAMTFDLEAWSGEEIPIEERGGEEVQWVWGRNDEGEESKVQITPEESPVLNPSFDVTPAKYVTAFITERGIIRPPYEGNLKRIFGEEERKI
jgi:S-methyl-5-thioribose-1-phosphate isomerase